MSLSTILVANRGEITRRIVRTAHSMGIRCIAVFVDADAAAPFVSEADESVRLASGYLDGAAIIEAALDSEAEAVHPGYGFLSERPGFAADVIGAGLTWIGPPPTVIAEMGDKLAAKRLAVAAGVPTLPSAESPGDADLVGYPLMVKAAAGGGGRGMRIVGSPADLDQAVASARREAAGGFGDDRVFLERYVATSRHIEIQILGDGHGNLVHLGERECSIQRRHQKLIEESPSPAVDDAMRTAMGEAALRLARTIGFQSAGTVEFLVDGATREFFFLEVNTRLQVEHPVTEEITGIDLVREQLRIAAGEPLGYAQRDIAFTGHAIEARLCAEDAEAGFLPATGTLAAFSPAEAPVVRWESGVDQGSVVSVAFDPMLAKVIAHAPTRAEAASRLALALERLHLGGVTTNRDFLAATLRHERFLGGETTTDFIERFRPARTLVLGDTELEWAATAAALWLQCENRASTPVLANLPSGWRNARLPAQAVSLRRGDHTVDVTYRSRRDGTFIVGDGGSARIHRRSPLDVDVEVNGRRSIVRVTHAGDHLHIQSRRGTLDFRIVPRFVVPGTQAPSGGLAAPMPGTVVEVRVAPGERVAAGTTLVVMEAMKMEHRINAPADGIVIDVLVGPGQQVDNGVALLVIEPEGAGPGAPGSHIGEGAEEGPR
ncbi:MAG TPA: biotin carboxylase N-terminal domain-containing protein [Acidimicrobiales bacterium]|nr:biotin carboxylase N-terminal domain-containing protein [Acidimicrobiales bacterium]